MQNVSAFYGKFRTQLWLPFCFGLLKMSRDKNLQDFRFFGDFVPRDPAFCQGSISRPSAILKIVEEKALGTRLRFICDYHQHFVGLLHQFVSHSFSWVMRGTLKVRTTYNYTASFTRDPDEPIPVPRKCGSPI